MLLYNVTVVSGQFHVVRRSVGNLSGDARIQALLIGFAFGAFLEGAAGAGSPVAICGAMLVGLGFDPLKAAVICLIANTSPVAYGGLGTPLLTLQGVTGLNAETLSVMAGHQLPFLSFFIPLYMVKVMCTWRQTFEVWPALLVAGGSFALFQFTFATMHYHLPGSLVLYPMTDVGGGIFALVSTACFLRYWRPRKEWHFDATFDKRDAVSAKSGPENPHAAETAALLGGGAEPSGKERPLTRASVSLAWAPFALMSLFLLLGGLLRQEENHRSHVKAAPLMIGPLRTIYPFPMPNLDHATQRAERLQPLNQLPHHPAEVVLLFANAPVIGVPAVLAIPAAVAAPDPTESAVFELSWATSAGTAVLLASLVSMVMLRMTPRQILRVLQITVRQMKVPIPTIACMLGLSYVTRYAGMDATLGLAFANTGWLYPFFAAVLGWLGVFLTGTDAGSNALFGSLQKITATEVFHTGAFTHLSLGQAQVLICTANSTGGVMGKMIDAQSICVATAATHQLGREADIFKAVVWHSIALATLVGLLTLLQAYVLPFTLVVPTP
jgi:lactate permease